MRQEHRLRSYQVGSKRWQRWALNFGAVLGSLCLILAALTFLFGLKPLIFASGSMGPQIPTGSLGIAVPTPVAEVSPGQVVSVVTSDGTRITHRVLENRPEGLVLKGDANAVADLQPYAVADADRLLFSVPLLGYVVSWFSQPWAFFLGGLLCAYLLYVAFIRPDSETSAGDKPPSAGVQLPTEIFPTVRKKKATDEQNQAGTWRFIGAAVTTLALVICLGLAVRVEPTRAAFNATAEASTGALTALMLPTIPNSLTCKTTGGVLGVGTSAEFSWANQTLPTGARYALRLQSGAQTFAYVDAPAGTTKATLSGGLNLLGLITSGGNQTLPVKVFAVLTTDGGSVNAEGTNIMWSTPVASSPGGSVIYHPGLLLVRYFSCP